MKLSSLEYTASLPRKRMGAGVLFINGAGRVLLVEPMYKESWEIPGGTVEADESPYAGAVREVKEELGLVVTPGRLLVVDWAAPRADRTEGVMFIYAGGILAPDRVDEIRLPADELRSWAWCTPAEADTCLAEQLANRVRAAVRAEAQGTTAYLENGRQVA